MPDKETAAMSRRILRHWNSASAEDLAAGMEWYARAETSARALAAGTHLSARQCAGIIAALSPRVQWQSNLDAAATMVRAATTGEASAPTVAGFTENREKAWKIALGEAPEDVLSGPKVRPFFANITGDPNEVTVDVWAARAAEGRDNPNSPKGRRYARIADAYRLAASAVGVTPREMQAAVWTHMRGQAAGTYRPSLARHK